jgi:phosphoglycerol transferase MdoB-like AlkP superfamily enzyme
MFPKAWTIDGLTAQHVPLLFYAPALLQPDRINKTCSQLDVLPSVTALAKIPYLNTTMGKNLFDTAMNNELPFPNAAFLYDYNVKQIGIVTDNYVYLNNLLTGKEIFRSSGNNEPVSLADTEKNKPALQTLSQAYYETARYMLLNNKRLK